MPALTYTSANFPFTPFTKIYSADINTCLNDIKTLLNTTGLDDTNIQNAGITRGTKLKLGTAGYVVINSGTGAMSEEQYLATSRGGLNADVTPAGASDSGKALVVNAAGTAFQLAPVSNSPLTLYAFYSYI